MTTITVNIGLDTNTNGNIGPATALRELAVFVDLSGHRIAQSATEQTVIARGTLKPGFDLPTVMTHLCHLLEQDRIAVSPDDGKTGVLIGPNADKWGEFNPAYFLPL